MSSSPIDLIASSSITSDITMTSVAAVDHQLIGNDHNSAEKIDTEHVTCSLTFAILILIMSVISTFTNLISVIVYSNPVMRSPINALLTGLSVIDMCQAILAIPGFVTPMLTVYVDSCLLKTVAYYSTLYIYPFTNMTQTSSVWTFVVITFERWIAVCRPFRARWSSIGRSLRALVIVCITAFIYNFPRFFEYTPSYKTAAANATEHYYDDQSAADSCYVGELDDWLRSDLTYMSFYNSGLYLITHFVVPFTVLVVVNAHMILSINQAREQRRILSKREKKEHRTAVMMCAVVLMFVCCNTLPFVMNIVEQLDQKSFYDRKLIMFTLNDLSVLLVLVNSGCTILIYYVCSQKYRRLLHRYLLLYWCAPCIWLAEATRLIDSRQAQRANYMRKLSKLPGIYSTVLFSSPAVQRAVSWQGDSTAQASTAGILPCNSLDVSCSVSISFSYPFAVRELLPGRRPPSQRSDSSTGRLTPSDAGIDTRFAL